MTVGSRGLLLKMREDNGISQEELARAAGMVPSTISRFEKGKRGMSAQAMTRVQAALLKLMDERAKKLQQTRNELRTNPLESGADYSYVELAAR